MMDREKELQAKIKDLTQKIRKFLNFLFLFLIIANIIMDLYFVGKIDYGNIVWMIIVMLFINIIK